MKYKNYDYYEPTIGTHAVLTSTTKGKNFIPSYKELPTESREFKLMEWPTYGETFGKLHGYCSKSSEITSSFSPSFTATTSSNLT